MYIIGIDGGGTHTRLEICDNKGNSLEKREYGSFNINSIGEEQFRHRISEIFDPFGSLSKCASLCIGAAGISANIICDIIRSKLKQLGFNGKLLLRPDYAIALRGAMAGPGAVLICGTGSVAYGVCPDGREIRIGGYGHLIDDGGSGYAIGRDGLIMTVRMFDGREETTGLKEAILAAINGTSTQDIINFIYHSSNHKAATALLNLTVLECADAGDTAALKILEYESNELILIASTIAKQMNIKPFRIALLGGLMEHDSLYKKIVTDKLSSFATVIQPEHNAIYGAVHLALEQIAQPDQSAPLHPDKLCQD